MLVDRTNFLPYLKRGISSKLCLPRSQLPWCSEWAYTCMFVLFFRHKFHFVHPGIECDIGSGQGTGMNSEGLLDYEHIDSISCGTPTENLNIAMQRCMDSSQSPPTPNPHVFMHIMELMEPTQSMATQDHFLLHGVCGIHTLSHRKLPMPVSIFCSLGC